MNTGRRIYIQEQCLIREGLKSLDKCNEVVECAASLSIPRILSHALSEIEFFNNKKSSFTADDLICSLNYRKIQSEFFRSIIVKDDDSGTRTVLGNNESIVANCYFSNYYTLATSEEASRVMFADNNLITNIKELKTQGIDLIYPKSLASKPSRSNFEDWISDYDSGRTIRAFGQVAIDLMTSELGNEYDSVNSEVIISLDRLGQRLNSQIDNISSAIK